METVCHPPTFFCLSLSLPALSSSIQIRGTLLAQKKGISRLALECRLTQIAT